MRIRAVRFAAEARQDMLNIRRVVRRDRPSAWPGLLNRIESACRHLVRYPKIGSDRSEVKRGAKSWVVTPCVLYYVPSEGRIDIRRVLHGAQDAPAHLTPEL